MSSLPRTIVLAWYERPHYADHVRLDPEGMKPRFKDWLREAESAEQRLQADGCTVIRVLIDPQELSAWALLHGAKIDPESRARFAHELFLMRHRH